MTITVFETVAFKKALAKVMPAALAMSTLPILEMVNVRFASLMANNLSLQISAPVNATGDPINVCVDGMTLRIIGQVAGKDIRFILENDVLTVKTGKHRFKPPTLSGADFPMIQEDEPDVTFPSTVEMHDALGRLNFAAAVKSVKYYLCGVFFQCDGTMMTAAATDGMMLAAMDIMPYAKPFEAIIPRESIEVLAKAPLGIMSVSAKMVTLESDEIRITCKCIDGKPIKWRPIIANDPDRKLTVNRAELLETITLSKIMRDKMKNRSISVAVKDGKLSVRSRGIVGEEVTTMLDLVDEADPLDTGVNGDHMEGALKSMNDENVTFMWKAPDQNPPTVKLSNGKITIVASTVRI